MSYLHPSNGKPGPLRRIPRDGLTDQRGGFNPKREARPSQTMTALPGWKAGVYSFNPKREARPSQTEALVLAARIQNGFNPKREARPSQTLRTSFFVAQTRGFNPKREAGPPRPIPTRDAVQELVLFQSQTGSQALSDTSGSISPPASPTFQSQTGSQALSDKNSRMEVRKT